MELEVTHTEFAKATPEVVWKFWSDVSTWSSWDHGLQWCTLNPGEKFELNAKGALMPKGAPAPVNFQIIECTPNKSFTDRATFELGSLIVSHTANASESGVFITHTFTFVPANPKTLEIFKNVAWQKIQQEAVQSVKTLATLTQTACQLECGKRT